MADSTIAITAGTGTAVDTRTEATNGHHRQVIVIGDPSTNAGVAPVDATAGLKVDLGADNDITGTVTANAGTNLNTSALALESGGNLAAIKAKTDNIPALGQALAAASVPVVLPAAQITTLTPPAAITGFATSANQTTIIGHVDGIETSLSSIDGKITAVNTGAVVVSSSALPTGASTAAKQPALGTAGTASADVITVQGIASMTALKVDGSAVTQPVSGTFWQATQPVSGTVSANATLSAETTKVIGTVNVAAAQTIAVTNAGTFATQATLQAGSAAIGKLAANSGVDIGDVDVTSLPALAAGTNTIGAVKSVPSDIDINGSNANHADKYYTNAGAVTDGIVWSPAAGKRWHILTLYINVSAAATVTLEDDLAGGDVARWKGELAANSGVILKYDKEHPFSSGEDAADLIITTTAGNVYVQAVGYEV